LKGAPCVAGYLSPLSKPDGAGCSPNSTKLAVCYFLHFTNERLVAKPPSSSACVGITTWYLHRTPSEVKENAVQGDFPRVKWPVCCNRNIGKPTPHAAPSRLCVNQSSHA
jgi:hypothetical protein